MDAPPGFLQTRSHDNLAKPACKRKEHRRVALDFEHDRSSRTDTSTAFAATVNYAAPLKASTGERIWETLNATTPTARETRWANAFIVKNDDRFFLFNEKGDLIIARLSPKGLRGDQPGARY